MKERGSRQRNSTCRFPLVRHRMAGVELAEVSVAGAQAQGTVM